MSKRSARRSTFLVVHPSLSSHAVTNSVPCVVFRGRYAGLRFRFPSLGGVDKGPGCRPLSGSEPSPEGCYMNGSLSGERCGSLVASIRMVGVLRMSLAWCMSQSEVARSLVVTSVKTWCGSLNQISILSNRCLQKRRGEPRESRFHRRAKQQA